MDGSEAFDWFCEQYEGNEIAQGLIRQLSQDTRYISDQWSVTYGHQIHKSVDVRDLIHFKGISERGTLDLHFQIPPETHLVRQQLYDFDQPSVT